VGLITRRSWVQIPPPPPRGVPGFGPGFSGKMRNGPRSRRSGAVLVVWCGCVWGRGAGCGRVGWSSPVEGRVGAALVSGGGGVGGGRAVEGGGGRGAGGGWARRGGWLGGRVGGRSAFAVVGVGSGSAGAAVSSRSALLMRRRRRRRVGVVPVAARRVSRSA